MTTSEEGAFVGLVERKRHGRSTKQMERDAGLPEGTLGNLLKPTGRRRRSSSMLETHVIEKVARVLDVAPAVLAEALAHDADLPLYGEHGGLSTVQLHVVGIMAELSNDDQKLLRDVARAFYDRRVTRPSR